MSSATSNSWRRQLIALPTEDGDRAVDSLHELLLEDDEETNVAVLRGETDTVFLARHPEGGVVFLHHVRVVGGTRVRPGVAIMALVGTGPRAYPVRLSPGEMFASVEVLTPTWSGLKDLNSKASVVAAAVSVSHEELPAYFALPPTLARALLDQDDLEPWSLIRPVRTAVSAYDGSRAAGFPAFDSATQVRRLPKWLWAAQTDNLPDGGSLVPTADPELIRIADRLHAEHITAAGQAPAGPGTGLGRSGTPPVGAPAPTGAGAASGGSGHADLVAGIADLKSELEAGRMEKRQALAEKKPGFSRLPAPVRKLLEFAAQSVSRTGQVSGSVPSSAKEFFASSTSGHASLNLSSFTLSSRYNIAANDKSGLATRLYTGNLFWTAANSPGNLTIFACGEDGALADTGSSRAVGMALAAAEGGGLTEAQQKEQTKQKLSAPVTVDGAVRQAELFAAVILMLTGESEVFHFVDQWIKHMEGYRSAYATVVAMDGDFVLKMFYFIDKTVQAFLEACHSARSRLDVPDDILACAAEKKRILVHQAPFSVPTQFALQAEAKAAAAGNEAIPGGARTPTAGTPPKKRTKVTNSSFPGTNEVGVAPSKPFARTYGSSNPLYDERPKVGTSKICPTWHLLGYCYSGCDLSSTHRKPSAAELAAIKDYVTKCNSSG